MSLQKNLIKHFKVKFQENPSKMMSILCGQTDTDTYCKNNGCAVSNSSSQAGQNPQHTQNICRDSKPVASEKVYKLPLHKSRRWSCVSRNVRLLYSKNDKVCEILGLF
jgi:hypothetical protein